MKIPYPEILKPLLEDNPVTENILVCVRPLKRPDILNFQSFTEAQFQAKKITPKKA